MQYRRVDVLEHVPEPYAGTVTSYVERLQELLVDVDEPFRTHRVMRAMKLTVFAAADGEHARATAAPLWNRVRRRQPDGRDGRSYDGTGLRPNARGARGRRGARVHHIDGPQDVVAGCVRAGWLAVVSGGVVSQ